MAGACPLGISVRFQISGIDLGRFLARNRSIDVFNIEQPLNEHICQMLADSRNSHIEKYCHCLCVHQMVSFMEGRLWISDNKASLLEIETGRDAPK